MSTATNNDDAADVRTERTFLLNADEDEDGAPEIVLLAQFVNRYDDTRVVVDTPAPWETPDGMAAGNDIIKSLEWDDHHYTFEENERMTQHENVWVLDESGVEELTANAEAEGYEVVDARDGEYEGNQPDEAFLEACRYTERGDKATFRYESKHEGAGIKTKTGTVTNDPVDGSGHLTAGIVIQRDDGKYNKLVADDDGTAEVHSSSQYPFMGEAVAVEITPGAGEDPRDF